MAAGGGVEAALVNCTSPLTCHLATKAYPLAPQTPRSDTTRPLSACIRSTVRTSRCGCALNCGGTHKRASATPATRTGSPGKMDATRSTGPPPSAAPRLPATHCPATLGKDPPRCIGATKHLRMESRYATRRVWSSSDDERMMARKETVYTPVPKFLTTTSFSFENSVMSQLVIAHQRIGEKREKEKEKRAGAGEGEAGRRSRRRRSGARQEKEKRGEARLIMNLR